MAKTTIDIDLICDMLIDGLTYREIAAKLDIKLSTLHLFTTKPEHSVRVREALSISADTYADKGERVLIEAKSTLVEVQRARELSQFYKWKASKRSPKTYADKVDVTSDGEKIQPVSLETLTAIASKINGSAS